MPVPRLVAVVLVGAAALAPSPPRLAATLDVGSGPCDVAVADRSVWVAVEGAGTLVRVDPSSSRVAKRLTIGRTACSIAAGRDALWVTRYRPSELVRVDRRRGTLTRLRLGSVPFDVLVASDVWTTWFDDGTLTRVDPRTLRVAARIRIGGSPAGLASCRGRVWVGGGRRDSWISAVDPATNTIERVDVRAESPSWPTCIAGELWSPTAHGVVRIDPVAARLVATIALAGTPARAAAAADGTIWVTDKERNLINRIDPATNAVVDEVPAGPGAFAMARVGSSMWVTSYAGRDLRRYVSAG